MPQVEHESVAIDPKRILYRASRYWYFVLLSAILGVTAAYLLNRYSPRVYQITASILIKESQEVSGGELLYNNPLVRFYRNYKNEIYLLESIPLLERTVYDLGFDESFYRVGNLRTSESYGVVPFVVRFLEPPPAGRLNFMFSIVGDGRVRMLLDERTGSRAVEVRLGEEIESDGAVFKLETLGEVPDIWIGEDFSYSLVPAREVAQRYRERLVASWIEEGSGLINLSITGTSPKKEIDFLEGLVRNYQHYDLERKNLAATNTISFIGEQLANISDSLNKVERQLQVFKNQNVVTDLGAEAMRLYQKVEALEVEKTELVLKESYYRYLTNYIRSDSLEHVILPSSVGITDPILTDLVSEVMALQTNVKLAVRGEKIGNPLVSDGLRRIEQLKRDILESVRNQRAVDRIKLDFLQSSIAQIDRQMKHLPSVERQLVNIKRNYSLLENLYVFLLQKHAEAGISKASNSTDIVLVNPPMVARQISPAPIRNYCLGLSLGICLPFAAFLLLEIFNVKVQSKDDIERITKIPFIGGIGHTRVNSNTEVLERPKSPISESFRALRSNLLFFLKGRDKGVFLITSSISGEGKTFTSINLAAILALSGKKTLIVGADMRRPKIYDDFGLSNKTGLSNFLAGFSEFDEVVQRTQYEDLHLVSGGPVPPNPAELLLGDRLSAFFEAVRSRYDFVVVDSPPLGLVTDALVLGAVADHTLFIVRQNYTPKSLLTTINEYYVQGKMTSMSIVFNDIQRSGLGYDSGYAYGYGYSYGRGDQGYYA